jgi:hypothetical protein
LLVQPGSFIGFLEDKAYKTAMIHAMIYAKEGIGYGTANACIFDHGGKQKGIGWEEIDLNRFFSGEITRKLKMIATPVDGQSI